MDFLIDNWYLVASAIVSAAFLAWPAFARGGSRPIGHLAATRLINDRDAVVVDVRPPAAFAAGHVPRARNVPLDEIDAARTADFATRPVIVVCDAGQQSARAAAKLRSAGCTEVHVLEGGLQAWRSAGLPVVR